MYKLPNVNLVYYGPDKRLYAGDGHHLFLYTNGSFAMIRKEGPDELVDVMTEQFWRSMDGKWRA